MLHQVTHYLSRLCLLICFLIAYYAHIASRRGKHLLNAGIASNHLVEITEGWLNEEQLPSIYFA
jgi:hypothetical protein